MNAVAALPGRYRRPFDSVLGRNFSRIVTAGLKGGPGGIGRENLVAFGGFEKRLRAFRRRM
jgi:hypothetical protein